MPFTVDGRPQAQAVSIQTHAGLYLEVADQLVQLDSIGRYSNLADAWYGRQPGCGHRRGI
jgi:hypothetical protein